MLEEFMELDKKIKAVYEKYINLERDIAAFENQSGIIFSIVHGHDVEKIIKNFKRISKITETTANKLEIYLKEHIKIMYDFTEKKDVDYTKKEIKKLKDEIKKAESKIEGAVNLYKKCVDFFNEFNKPVVKI